jgi:hypothetical protein
MKKYAIVGAAAALSLSLSVFAAKPVKITPGDKGQASGADFRNYVVECSNGKRQPLTSWDNGKKWCLGQGSQESCVKKQIKAAKSACKLD